MSTLREKIQWLGLFIGPLAALTVFLTLPEQYQGPDGSLADFARAGRVTLAVMVWMAIWWMTEAIEISTTALLPIALLPIFGAVTIVEATAPYANKLIFLYIGGFIIALSMQRWGLDKRIALTTLKVVGTKPASMIGGFMIATAGLSAFMSNTATTAMMLPIALSVIALLKEKQSGSAAANFGVCLMLGIAYSASMGGISTLVGTPPNAFLASFVEDSIAEPYRTEISFARWMMIGIPMTLIMLPIIWVLLTKFLYPVSQTPLEGGGEIIRTELGKLGVMKRGEIVTLVIFLTTAICWITRPKLQEFFPILSGLTDPGIAIIAATLLFIIPADVAKREFVMNWDTALKMPWDILILFGGGMSLAGAVKITGVAEFIGSQAGHFAGVPNIVLILIVVTAVILLTELTSNLATTATLLPVLASLAPGLGVHPYLLIFTATIAASCAFMMPVATPPNAIVFGSRQITIPQMMKAGVWLNIAGIIVITLLAMLLIETVTGVKF
jgi:sodium-dependent dicarboxylate transporter 2/3/5